MSFPHYPKYKDSGIEWLREVPTNWRVLKFRYAFCESSEKIESDVVGPMLSVSGYRGIEIKKYDDENRRRTNEELIGYRIVRVGQLVVNTMWLNYAGLGVSEHEGHVSPAYRSYYINEMLAGRFAHYLMRSGVYVAAYTQLLTGVRPNSLQMSREDLMSFPVLVPPLAEQGAIAAFLDRETAKIDALVVEQQRLIKLLDEKRQAVISHAVTKGLNPDAPVKSSGIEWLGQIPTHWALRELRHLIDEGTTITYGIVQAGPDTEGGVPYIRTSDMSGDVLPMSGYLRTTHEIDAAYRRSKVRRNDLVVAIRASLGKGLLVPDHLEGANLTQGTARVSPGAALLPKFLLRAFNSEYCQSSIRIAAKGTTFLEITLDELRRVPLAVPPIQEQAEIVESIDAQVSHFDQLINEAVRAAQLLEERRTALISAAVTGQIDVRGLGNRSAA